VSSPAISDPRQRYQLFVRTRAWATDYHWIGATPRTQWWKSGPPGPLLTNQTGLYKTTSTAGPRLIITGISGTRQDSHGTRIRYDLAIEPDPNGPLTNDDVAALIQAYWHSRNNSQLGQQFDQLLGASANNLIEQNSPEVANTVIKAIQNLPRSSAPTLDPEQVNQVSWMGAHNSAALTMVLHSPEVLHSALLNTDVRDELLRKSSPPVLIVEGESGSGTRPAAPSKALQPASRSSKALTTTGGGGCLIAVGALTLMAASIVIRHPARSPIEILRLRTYGAGAE